MKNSKLFKRIGALLTAVAVLASMGTVAFATEGETATITIGDATIAPAATNQTGEGLYTITVPYTVAGTIGDKGVTALAYAKGSESADDLVVDEDEGTFTQYSSDYKIAYVTQEAAGSSISFNVDTTGVDAIKVGAGEKILVLIGGDGVASPASVLLTTYWEADDIVIDGFDGFSPALDVDLGAGATAQSVFTAAIDDYALKVSDGENVAAVAWEDATIAVAETTAEEKTANGDATHKATITVGTDVELTGAYIKNAITETVYFNVNEFWTPDTLTISDTTYTVYGSDLEPATQETITAALKTAVLAETIKVSKAGKELEAEVTDDAKDDITVEIKEGTLDGSADAPNVTFVVTLPAATNVATGVTVGTEALTTDITLNYVKEKPTSWEVQTATFKYDEGETAFDVTYDAPDGTDKVEKAKAALVGEVIELKGTDANQVYEYEISSGNIDGAEASENGATVTISIPEGDETEYGGGIVSEPMSVTINIAYTENTAGFTASDAEIVGGATLDVTVDENTAEKIKAAIAAEELQVQADLTRGTYTAEDVVIDVTADMITVTAPTLDESETTGGYTATITIGTDVAIEIIEGYERNLAAPLPVTLTGTVTVESYKYGDADGDGEITGLDATVVKRHVAGFSENINLDAADVDSDGEVTGLDATIIMRTVAGFYQESDLPLAPQ